MRPDILDLGHRFDCAGSWGIERCFNAWVERQRWRWYLPLNFFQWLTCLQHSSRILRFDVPVPGTPSYETKLTIDSIRSYIDKSNIDLPIYFSNAF